MTAPQESSNRIRIIVKILTIIAAVATIVTAFLKVTEWLERPKDSGAQVVVRVADSTGASVSGANVLLFFEGGPLGKYTDVNGTANFNVSFSNSVDVRLIVETDQYEIYEREIQLPRDKRIDVHLKERSPNTSSVIVRVVDDDNSVPIPGADILLLVEGDVYSQPTDSNGIAKFTVSFSNGKIDAQMSVSTKDYEIEYQRITLLPNKVQDIRLNPHTQVIRVSSVLPSSTPEPTATASNLTIVIRQTASVTVEAANPTIEIGQTVSGTIATSADTDMYTFAANAGDVVLAGMGRVSGSLWPKIRLYDPEGNLLNTGSGSYNTEITGTLSVAGIHTIIVSDGYDGTCTGEYNLYLQRLNNPINAIPLSPGQTVSSAIDVSIKMGIYTFTANAGDTILIGMGRVSGSLWPKIRLYDPEGSLLNTESDSYHAEITETLSATGIHTIIVSDGYDGTCTGEYSINLQKLP